MLQFTEEFMLAVERRFIRFMLRTVDGIRKDYYRKKIRQEAFAQPFNESFPSITHLNNDPSNELMQILENEKVIGVLNTLTPRQRDILYKVIVEQRTEIEVAELYKITQQSVNKTKNRALNNIKIFYSEEE